MKKSERTTKKLSRTAKGKVLRQMQGRREGYMGKQDPVFYRTPPRKNCSVGCPIRAGPVDRAQKECLIFLKSSTRVTALVKNPGLYGTVSL